MFKCSKLEDGNYVKIEIRPTSRDKWDYYILHNDNDNYTSIFSCLKDSDKLRGYAPTARKWNNLKLSLPQFLEIYSTDKGYRISKVEEATKIILPTFEQMCKEESVEPVYCVRFRNDNGILFASKINTGLYKTSFLRNFNQELLNNSFVTFSASEDDMVIFLSKNNNILSHVVQGIVHGQTMINHWDNYFKKKEENEF